MKKINLTKKQNDILKIIIAVAVMGISLIMSFVSKHNGEKNVNSQPRYISDENVQGEVHFVDIGQGDATLVMSDGEAMLVDTGDTDTEDRLISYMKENGVEKLKYLVITHPHADHMGEAKDVLKNFPTEKIIIPKLPENMTPTNYVYQKFLKEVSKQKLKLTAASDCEFQLGKCNVQMFTPKKDYDNLNNYSSLVKITSGSNSFLITGDCEKEEEQDILSQNFNLKADVLKAGHHGSSTSSGKNFLDKVKPDYSVISCGEDNKYGHPHKETLNRLKKISQVYVTKDSGSIVFKSDGKNLTVQTSQK